MGTSDNLDHENVLDMKIHEADNLVSVRMGGVFSDFTSDWLEMIARHVEARPMDVLLNLKDLTHLESRALTAMFDLHKRVQDLGHRLYFTEISDPVREAFAMSGLDRVLHVASNDKAATHIIRLSALPDGDTLLSTSDDPSASQQLRWDWELHQ